MHPILREPRRLGYYLLAWIPAELLLILLTAPRPLTWLESTTIVFPLCTVYAFVCLSTFYLCRAFPLGEAGVTRHLWTHLLNGVVGGGIWVGFSKILGSVAGIPADRLDSVLPLFFGVGALLYLLSVAMHWAFLEVQASQAAQRREAEAKLLAGEAELRALKAQINPHFLYNSLNSISALTGTEPQRARLMCIQLSEFLRSTLGLSAQAKVPLAQELDLLRRYLEIEKTRFGARLQIEEDISQECLQDQVLALLLQPLAENAIVHGISSLVEGGVLYVGVRHSEEHKLTIVMENAVDEETLLNVKEGFGLSSIKKRLQTAYGAHATLTTTALAGRFRAELVLPGVERTL
jgi:LytS/YehU family sensor histidine kinase